jgi:hypothetical protein
MCSSLSSHPEKLLRAVDDLKCAVTETAEFSDATTMWTLVSRCTSSWQALYEHTLAEIYDENEPLEVERLTNRLRIANILRFAGRQTFTVRESSHLCEALRDCGLPMTYWNRHLLNIIAAYHAG